jgi:anti-sigma factor RsiW
MTLQTPSPAPSDAELVTYLDGELSPADSVRIGQRIAADREISTRIDLLMKGGRPFRDAFAPLLEQAPTEKLDAMLAAAIDRRQPEVRHAEWPRRFWPSALVASVALMALGAGLDRLVISPIASSFVSTASKDDASDYWRRAVTQYLSLYTSETLSIIPDTADTKRQELVSLGSWLGLDLDPTRVEFPDMALKRAEMFHYDGQALGFLAYLDPKSGPVSLCIIAGAGRDAAPRVEQRRGMTVIYWSRSGHGFMLIGRGSLDDLQTRAGLVASRFGGTPLDHATDERG